ncbi:hypothetical protein [Pteropox virus]|uniref:Uncharacterized protein n=1 Tax=Pteropox virus TaxID=1873698 RepID=A0A1B1MR78_9POXV|nr:hypothetical protein [Pteropox virus]ANS71086.1 hypothetical protein [Pteropox virus]
MEGNAAALEAYSRFNAIKESRKTRSSFLKPMILEGNRATVTVHAPSVRSNVSVIDRVRFSSTKCEELYLRLELTDVEEQSICAVENLVKKCGVENSAANFVPGTHGKRGTVIADLCSLGGGWAEALLGELERELARKIETLY